ncbi:PAS domain S-box-containing protein [Rubellimicrobium aerolatum]|nr:PAS domain S-box-containing protein [Rubellimicrobium aerolatum]
MGIGDRERPAEQGPEAPVERERGGPEAGRSEAGRSETGGSEAGGPGGQPNGDLVPDGSLALTGHHQGRHWRESTITDDDLSDRGGVFFAAVEMTRMPMILTDPRRPDNPIAFANKAVLDLAGYEEAEVLGRNCRFLQGPRTDRDTVRQAHQPVSLEILNCKRDGTPFWNAVFIGPVSSPDGELLCATTAGPRVDLQLNLRHRLPPCFMDVTHLETALLNIALNARDAMPDGGTVTVATSRAHWTAIRPRATCRPGTTWSSPSPTRGRGCRPPSPRRRWSPSSPPRARARGRASASPWCMASSSSRGAGWRSTARSGAGPPCG